MSADDNRNGKKVSLPLNESECKHDSRSNTVVKQRGALG